MRNECAVLIKHNLADAPKYYSQKKNDRLYFRSFTPFCGHKTKLKPNVLITSKTLRKKVVTDYFVTVFQNAIFFFSYENICKLSMKDVVIGSSKSKVLFFFFFYRIFIVSDNRITAKPSKNNFRYKTDDKKYNRKGLFGDKMLENYYYLNNAIRRCRKSHNTRRYERKAMFFTRRR